jgi:hypothetical protein
MFKPKTDFPFPYTQDPEALAPAFLAKDRKRLSNGYEDRERFFIKLIEDYLRKSGIEELHLAAHGSENLVFTCIDRGHQRKIVFKANYLFGLSVLEEVYAQTHDLDQGVRASEETLEAECARQRAQWAELRAHFPGATIPAHKIDVYHFPLEERLWSLMRARSRIHSEKTRPTVKLPPTFPLLVNQQRLVDAPEKRSDRIDFGFEPIWRQQLDGRVLDIYTRMESIDSLLMRNRPAQGPVADLLRPIFPEMVGVWNDVKNRPEEYAQIARAIQSMDRYLQETRTGIDIIGSNNVQLMQRKLPAGAKGPWDFLFIDPFFPRVRPAEEMTSLTTVEQVIEWAKELKVLTPEEKEIARRSLHIYYLALGVKAWSKLFEVTSTLTLKGIEDTSTSKLRRLYTQAVGFPGL